MLIEVSQKNCCGEVPLTCALALALSKLLHFPESFPTQKLKHRCCPQETTHIRSSIVIRMRYLSERLDGALDCKIQHQRGQAE
jgi:hypothetical protein